MKHVKTLGMYFNTIAWQVLSALLTLFFSSFFSLAHATQQSNDKVVDLYLPINSSEFPNLTQQLQAALAMPLSNRIKVINIDFRHPYQHGIKTGRLGIFFTEPHFATWAITKHNFRPVYKLHGKLKYVLTTQRSNTNIFELNDLIGKTICREVGLNLGTVWLNQLLSNSKINANVKEVLSVEQIMLSNDQQCDAYVLDNFSYVRSNKQLHSKYIRLAQSAIYEHNAFVAHPQIPNEFIEKFKRAIKSQTVKNILKPYLKSLSKWQNFKEVKDSDYMFNDTLLLQAYWQD